MRDYRLSEIRAICRKQESCEGCPLNIGDELDPICELDTLPSEYKFDFECTEEGCPYYNDGYALNSGNCLRPKSVECPKTAEYGSATTISISPTDKPMIIEANTPDEFIIYNEENKNENRE